MKITSLQPTTIITLKNTSVMDFRIAYDLSDLALPLNVQWFRQRYPNRRYGYNLVIKFLFLEFWFQFWGSIPKKKFKVVGENIVCMCESDQVDIRNRKLRCLSCGAEQSIYVYRDCV